MSIIHVCVRTEPNVTKRACGTARVRGVSFEIESDESPQTAIESDASDMCSGMPARGFFNPAFNQPAWPGASSANAQKPVARVARVR